MKKISLWVLAAILTCSTSVITTSCDLLGKIASNVSETISVVGEWEVTNVTNSSNANFKVGEKWTINPDHTYVKSTGENGNWNLYEKSYRTQEKNANGKFKTAEEVEFGVIQSLDDSNMEILVTSVPNYNGVIKLKKTKKIDILKYDYQQNK